jgi:hypothetical protein
MLYAGLDLSRHRVDVHLMNEAGEPVLVTVARRTLTGSAAWPAKPRGSVSRWPRRLSR